MEVGDEDYFLEYGVHRNVGPDGNSSVMCLEVTYGDRCPICEDARTQRKQGQRDDLPWPSRKVVYNVMDADGDSEIMVFDVSENLFHKELKGKLGRSERGFFDYSDLQEGAIVKCWVEEKRGGKYTFNQYKDFEFVDRDPLPANLLEKAIPLETLLNVPTVEDVDALFDGQIASIDYQNGNEESESDGGSSEPVEDESDEEVDEAPESETSAPKEEEKEEKLSAKEKSRARSKAAKKDRCKCGLRFGKDWDTVKEKCVAQCDDLEFDECRIAQEAAE